VGDCLGRGRYVDDQVSRSRRLRSVSCSSGSAPRRVGPRCERERLDRVDARAMVSSGRPAEELHASGLPSACTGLPSLRGLGRRIQSLGV